MKSRLTLIVLSSLALVIMCDAACRGWTCRSGECLTSISNYCDGVIQCADGTDERDCSFCSNGFRCDNGSPLCISSVSYRCNGVADCSDGSDERNCGSIQSDIIDNISNDHEVDLGATNDNTVKIIIGVVVAVVVVIIFILACICFCVILACGFMATK